MPAVFHGARMPLQLYALIDRYDVKMQVEDRLAGGRLVELEDLYPVSVEGPLGGAAIPDEDGSEFNAYTLTGEYGALIAAFLRFVEEGQEPDPPLEDEILLDRLRGHIHRGVGTLSVRAKSPADILRLVPTSA